MANLMNITVRYAYRTHVFEFELNEMLVDDILRLIGDYFHIDEHSFFLEIYDERSQVNIVLDDSYLDILRSDPYFVVNNSFTAELYSLIPSTTNIRHDSIPSSLTSSEEIKLQPEHTLMWLYEHFDDSSNYYQLINYFYHIAAVDVTSSIFSEVEDININNLIRLDDASSFSNYHWNEIARNFYIFSSIVDCLNFIERESKSYKNIFLICSGKLSGGIIPKIYHYDIIHTIYILTSNILRHFEWIHDYIDKISMFDHHLDLLSRITRDIATFYEHKSSAESTKTLQRKLTYLYWTKRLLIKANTVDNITTQTARLLCIEKRISELERLNNKTIWQDEEKIGVECQER